MAKMTMHQELDLLRSEVEALKKEKEALEKKERAESLKADKAQEKLEKEAEKDLKEIRESAEADEAEFKDALSNLLETFKKDYENLSPTSAIVLFALGAAFGHALSSK